MIKKPVRKDGLFAFQVRHLRTNEDLLHSVYFPLTKGLPHTIKMFYFVYGKKKYCSAGATLEPYSSLPGLVRFTLEYRTNRNLRESHRRDEGQRSNFNLILGKHF